MTDLTQLRTKINEIDSELVSLFKKRLDIVRKIKNIKEKNNLEILDSAREQEILNKFLSLEINNINKIYIENFLNSILNISKKLQKDEINKKEVNRKE